MSQTQMRMLQTLTSSRKNTSAHHHHNLFIFFNIIILGLKKLMIVQNTTNLAKDDQAYDSEMILQLHLNHIQCIFNVLTITFHAI